MVKRGDFFAHGSLNRKEWSLNWNRALRAGGFAVGDKIEIHLAIKATKASRPQRPAG